jgi:hypothetical protein
MADGLCAVDTGSAAEWKQVVSSAETRCAAHLHVESKLGRQPGGAYPGPTLGRHPTPGVAIIRSQILAAKTL